ncbi:MAG: DNA polymerase III subunit beta [Anaerohalosphaeraceae bacterium]|nr:DNA polymerase III subunit beta [Anaerohalosphaeraceae bacterium]
MKVKFNRAAMAEVLALVTTVVPSRSAKPILQCLKIQADSEGVSICATDLEISITSKITQAQVETEGVIVIPADRFTAIVRESIDEVIEIEASEAVCQIRGNDSHFTIYGHEPSQYPAVVGFDGAGQIEAELDKMQEAIDHCLFATAKENTRYALSGILWEPAGKKLTMVGTDGRRLAKFKINLCGEIDKKVAEEKIIVPAKAMAILDRVGGDGEAVKVQLAGNRIILACGDVVISSNLVEGNFPKYEDIIPTDYKNKLLLNTAATLSAVRRAALLTNEDSKGVKMSVSKNAVVFSSRVPETGDAEVSMAAEYDGEPVEIGFNPQFLVDVLRVIKEEAFEFHLSQSDRPGMIKSGPNFVYIVMPVSLS